MPWHGIGIDAPLMQIISFNHNNAISKFTSFLNLMWMDDTFTMLIHHFNAISPKQNSTSFKNFVTPFRHKFRTSKADQIFGPAAADHAVVTRCLLAG